MEKKVLFVSNKKWGKEVFRYFKSQKTILCEFTNNQKDLENKINKKIYDYVFLLHWGNKISKTIIKKSKFIGFHASDLPKYAGGSPIQNQIINGVYKTKLTAFLLNCDYDQGPIVKKTFLSLEGSLDDIFLRCQKKSIKLIDDILNNKFTLSTNKKSKSKIYKRLNTKDNDLRLYTDLHKIYDVIRMVDSKEFKKAFIILNKKFKIEFYSAKKNKNAIKCNVIINNIDL